MTAAEPPNGPLIRVGRETTVFESAGSMGFFESLVNVFYSEVAADPVLLQLYPEQNDLEPAKGRLTLFLAQYFGGPTTYSDERGHPRLRMRHFPFAIGELEADHWLTAMTVALDQLNPPQALREQFDAYFAMASKAMINKP